MGATFNDTTLEKAQCFKGKQVFLCLAVWKNASDLLFVCYGQNKKIGEFLEDKVLKFLSGQGGVRSTQTLGIKQLIADYGFDIICIRKNKTEVKKILSLKSRQLQLLDDRHFLSLQEYRKKYNYLRLSND